jgi:predicted RNase H-like HicB family nuclease
MIFSAVITEAEEGGYVAFNSETGTKTQGESFDEAVANLREATELYLDVFPMKAKGHSAFAFYEWPGAQAAGRLMEHRRKMDISKDHLPTTP